MSKRRGIRKKVTYAVTLLVIVSLTLLGTVLSIQIFNTEKHEIIALQNEVLNYAINEITWDSHEIEMLLHITTVNYDLLSLSTKKQFDALSLILMHKDIKQHNVLDEFVLLNREGRELAKVSRRIVYSPSELGDRSKTDEFTVPARTGETYYGPMIFDESTHEPRLTLSIPIIDLQSGAVEGMLIGNLRLHKIWENVVVRPFKESGIICITNSTGKVVAHPNSSVVFRNTVFKAESPSGIQMGLNGERVMILTRQFFIGREPFIVIASLPFREVISLSLNTLSITAVFICLFIILTIFVSYFLMQRIVRPIETLADTARDISIGKIGQTVKVGNSDEIGDLSSAFNTMTSKLLDSIDSLNKQMGELKQAEDKIKKQNEFLNVILNSLTHPFYVIDANDYTVKLANDAAQFGILTGNSTCYALTHNSHKPCEEAEHPCVIATIRETHSPVTLEHIHNDDEGNPIIVEVHGYPVFDSNGNITEVIEYNLDITNRKQMEEALQLSEQKNRSITATANDAMIMMDDKGYIIFWNPAAERIFGYSIEEALTMELHPLIAPERYHEAFKTGIKRFSDSGQGPSIGKTLEIVARNKDGTEFPVELSLTSIKVKDKWNAIGIVRDITTRKESENSIIASLKEKEILLREIHHRTKNNMQVISSLLNLQSEYIKDESYIVMLNESRNRIAAMALVHEKLYRSQNLADIDLNDYIESLTSGLFAFYGISKSRITLKLGVQNVSVELETAIPCGLIINELVSNALKHAFPDGKEGELSIQLSKITSKDAAIEYHLTIKDDGVGIPEDLNIEKVKSLGLQLVTNLVEHQLQGSLVINRTGGTEFRIKFAEIMYKKRF